MSCRTVIVHWSAVAVVVGLAFVSLALFGAPQAQAAGKGIEDNRLERASVDDATIASAVDEIGGGQLNVGWTKIAILWDRLQPDAPIAGAEPAYNETYFATLDKEIAAFHAAGVHVILTESGIPRWASDASLWSSPPPSYAKGYQPFYAPSAAGIAAFGELGKELATRFGTYDVLYECWNEPNLYYYLYPQMRTGASYYGPSTYLKMLKAFHAGVKSVLPGDSSIVIAGANSPRGGDDAVSTTPMRFAKYLKSQKVLNWCDAYSHHPYQTGGKSLAPGQRPPSAKSVTMGNIKQLLDLFPKTPFYLTEYGYSTHDTKIGLVRVSEVQQATYLRQAYSIANKYRQIKVLIWYLVRDSGPYVPLTSPYTYLYTGLRKHDGTIKPSWYAFSGGNKLSLKAPTSVKRSVAFAVSGILTTRDPAWSAGKRIQLQARPSSNKPWKVLKTLTVAESGQYSFKFLKQTATRQYRVVWPGVCTSPTRTVRVR